MAFTSGCVLQTVPEIKLMPEARLTVSLYKTCCFSVTLSFNLL